MVENWSSIVIQRTWVRFPAGRPWGCIFRNWSRFRSYNVYIKGPMERNFQVGDNNIKVMFDIASLDCESLRTNNEIEVCLFSV